ncbi:MAG TPA: methionyl-tRNA formyltransferase [Methylomicrobium sp.]|nr:methionyl-tRNA formyltransferase [Methylomicrobium sp.]
MRIIFAGTPEFAVPTLKMLLASPHEVCAVYTQPDRPAGRGRKMQPSPIKETAETAGIPVLQPESFKSPEATSQLAAYAADLMIVVAYGMILPQTVLEIPRFGCLNIHASLLPRWRGAAPIQRALMAGDRETGVTIMRIVRKLDAGDMLHKEVLTIEPMDTAGELHDKLAILGPIGLAKVLTQVENGTVHAEPQDETRVTYAAKLEKSEARLEWTKSAVDIDRQIRGLNPWPVAQTSYKGEILRIWRAQLIDDQSCARPGLVSVMNKQLEVATGAGRIRLLEVQLPGGKRMPAEAFLNAHDIHGSLLV